MKKLSYSKKVENRRMLLRMTSHLDNFGRLRNLVSGETGSDEGVLIGQHPFDD